MNTVNWSGYQFNVYTENTDWHDVGGIYIFAGLNQQKQWVALYIGQADSFRNRIPSHEQLNPSGRLGATHIHALVVPSQIQRDAIERLLIQNHQPHLNVQHK
jgi:excinuclease UvrABC nuclease subunit